MTRASLTLWAVTSLTALGALTGLAGEQADPAQPRHPDVITQTGSAGTE
ncbi:hypothetical protein Aph01nite_51250 [Acrocarpospora phusangensis]|uniref:Uncharacterized protein n=1 Tax=Acrocarpospora phusangensis TaxID=1070424 RepID=A0A919QI35_9ACTN|nr:hypothetical protein [Acrocarpospora phusangensis]GIH26815.1 hypothetical protein Aph01nite_51250 [Acrocarpospora phusangensis]